MPHFLNIKTSGDSRSSITYVTHVSAFQILSCIEQWIRGEIKIGRWYKEPWRGIALWIHCTNRVGGKWSRKTSEIISPPPAQQLHYVTKETVWSEILDPFSHTLHFNYRYIYNTRNKTKMLIVILKYISQENESAHKHARSSYIELEATTYKWWHIIKNFHSCHKRILHLCTRLQNVQRVGHENPWTHFNILCYNVSRRPTWIC